MDVSASGVSYLKRELLFTQIENVCNNVSKALPHGADGVETSSYKHVSLKPVGNLGLKELLPYGKTVKFLFFRPNLSPNSIRIGLQKLRELTIPVNVIKTHCVQQISIGKKSISMISKRNVPIRMTTMNSY